LIYFEPENAKVNSQIRLGMLFVFKDGESFISETLKNWEATMVNDLQSLYPDSNKEFLKNGDRLFNDSTISE